MPPYIHLLFLSLHLASKLTAPLTITKCKPAYPSQQIDNHHGSIHIQSKLNFRKTPSPTWPFEMPPSASKTLGTIIKDLHLPFLKKKACHHPDIPGLTKEDFAMARLKVWLVRFEDLFGPDSCLEKTEQLFKDHDKVSIVLETFSDTHRTQFREGLRLQEEVQKFMSTVEETAGDFSWKEYARSGLWERLVLFEKGSLSVTVEELMGMRPMEKELEMYSYEKAGSMVALSFVFGWIGTDDRREGYSSGEIG
ncbi:hypothetical protein BJ508DRAFT_310172 [Ascobolus immersus RN42]|uniref:Uncharacterized protein n=1 Tax=Ascobolus immersus RN42 TaxID=1160509 RepID=A0A3N4I6R8_ASCIM|nr:hypothetical protein BJ508DRAFT_310172 [Ascobolus immersus RN42]